MEPARYTIAFSPEPQDLVSRLAPVLLAQGSPAVTVSREGGSLTFVSETGEFMLRARVADALTAVCVDWQERIARASNAAPPMG
ncbi:MAG: hypothetical protein ACRDK0_04380 [Solirubrobacteraceae bacterium]